MKVFVVHIVLQLCILSVIYVYCFRIANALKPTMKLRRYDMPAALRRVINHGFKNFENMNPSDVQELKEVKYVSHCIKELVKC